MLRITFGSKKEEGTGVQRKLYDDLHTKYHGHQIKKMKWVGNVASMGAKRDVYRLSVEKPGGKRQNGGLGRRLEDNTKVDLKAIGGILWAGFSGLE